jgi:hypothetical protein
MKEEGRQRCRLSFLALNGLILFSEILELRPEKRVTIVSVSVSNFASVEL